MIDISTVTPAPLMIPLKDAITEVLTCLQVIPLPLLLGRGPVLVRMILILLDGRLESEQMEASR